MDTKFTLDHTVYYRGVYYRRFVTVTPGDDYYKRRIGYHTYPSTPGVHYQNRHALWSSGLGSRNLVHSHSYRDLA